MAFSWTPEKDKDLIDLVESAETVESGLNIVAELFGTTFYSVRNRWYSDAIKMKRKMSDREIINKGTEIEVRNAEYMPIEYINVFETTNTILEATRDYMNKVNNEVSMIRDQMIKLQGDNADWIRRYSALEEKHKSLEEDFSILSRILNRARVLANEEEIGPKPEPKKFIQDTNGNLEVAAM